MRRILDTEWPNLAAENMKNILNYLGDYDGLAAVDIASLQDKIQHAFTDRANWNREIMESNMPGIVKLWLVVP